ncbi:MAG: hypothetical protein ACUVX8_10660 [Candidatus Zipacnadales bacterium]
MIISAWALTWAVIPASCQERALTLTGSAPCNVFVEGEEILFTRSEGNLPPLSYRVTDYDGVEVAEGKATGATVRLVALSCGYYELTWRADQQTGTTSFGVVPPRPDEPPPAGPLVVDGAIAWLCAPDQWEPIARTLRRTGIGWMRERLSWGQVNPQPGTLEWGKYETVAEVLTQQGVRVYQIFHDSPAWTHEGKDTRMPDDLREVYRFTKAAAAHFKGRILAWEPWNEPDISFFDQLGDKYAGLQKAAFLGFRAGQPKAWVLLCSLCRGQSSFSDNIFESGVAEYMDIFNFHTYAPIDNYVDNLRMWIGLAERYGVGDQPIWLTEAGIRLTAADGSTLTPEQERTQAEFVPRSFAISLASGVDKHFFFVLPFYPEHGVQFGALRRDTTPRPAFIAIATAARLLGKGHYLGQLSVEPASVQAYVFDTGQEIVAVVWSPATTQTQLRTRMRSVRVADLVGRERQVQTEGGTLRLEVGPSAQYVLGLGDASAQLTGDVRPPGKLPSLNPSKVVIMSYLDSERQDKDTNCHLVRGDRPITLIADVYNFNEEKETQGTLSVELPAGWQAVQTEATVHLEALGRQTIRFELTPGFGPPAANGLAKVWVRGDFPGPQVAPSVSYARIDLNTVIPTRRLDLGLNDPTRWQRNIPGYGKMEIKPGAEGGVSFPITYHAPGDRWCYPRVVFGETQDWRAYQGLAFEYRFDTEDDSTSARVQVTERGGSSYLCGPQPASKDWQRAVIAFIQLSWGSHSAADANGHLDLDQIASIMIGCNTRRLEKLTLEVRNVELLAFD